MEQSAVTEIEFGRFPLSFSDVFKPRLQASDDEGVFEDVEMVGDGGTAAVERLPEFGEIQEFAMEMGAHHPESPQLGGGYPHSVLREVAQKEGFDKILPPGE